MSYIEDSLSTDEEIQHIFQFHWSLTGTIYFFILLSMITSLAVTKKLGIELGAISLILVVCSVYSLIRLRYIEQGVTNKRVIYKHGIIARKSNEIKLESIETIEIDQSVAGRILGYGTVRMTGKGISDFFFSCIDEPIEVKKKVESVVSNKDY